MVRGGSNFSTLLIVASYVTLYLEDSDLPIKIDDYQLMHQLASAISVPASKWILWSLFF